MGLDWIPEELERLQTEGLLRTRRQPWDAAGPYLERGEQRLLNLASNDYLSLARAAPAGEPTGSGASRLVTGDLAGHHSLECALADWLRVEQTLLFSSGYAANVGTVAALSGPGTLVVSDSLNHASIVDGCRLSRARVVVTEHGSVDAVRLALAAAPERRRLIVTDGYFSMDGDFAPIAALRAVCDQHGATLLIDEAHALGVWGPEGRGVSAAAGVRPDVVVGTLGKSFGAAGAFVAGSAPLIRWLWNRARSFVFSTGIAPTTARAALEALPLVREGERTARLHLNTDVFRQALTARGVAVLSGSRGPIVPIVLGDADRAVRRASDLEDVGIFVHPIRPPTVPRGTSRLRLTVQSGHNAEDLVRAADAIAQVLR